MSIIHIPIGYWFNKNDEETKDYPTPSVNTATDAEVERTVLILRHEIRPRAHVRHYRGISMCRICGCFNHASEYEYRYKEADKPMVILKIPFGLEHYIVEHKVLIPELLKIKFT